MYPVIDLILALEYQTMNYFSLVQERDLGLSACYLLPRILCKCLLSAQFSTLKCYSFMLLYVKIITKV